MSRFTHVYITRPREASAELAAMIAHLGLKTVVQPAFRYVPVDARAEQPELFDEMASASGGLLFVFTSPRSVRHGLGQLPPDRLSGAEIAAIGPSTGRALAEAGIPVSLRPGDGYTSEDLLASMQHAGDEAGAGTAFIIAAPGGRRKLAEGLAALGWRVRTLMAYRAEAEDLDSQALEELGEASGVLSVWTSGNAMKALSQRLPPASWFQLCQGEWVVISERLRRLARAFGPSAVHVASGPTNQDLLAAVRSVM
jgi:uroporphyrinogen-III synthase